jgi:hypothetical protein
MLLAKLTHGYTQQETVERHMQTTEVQRVSFVWIMAKVYYNCAAYIVTLSKMKLWPRVRNNTGTDNRQKKYRSQRGVQTALAVHCPQFTGLETNDCLTNNMFTANFSNYVQLLCYKTIYKCLAVFFYA